MDVAYRPLVAVLNTSEDFIALLMELLEMEGFRSVADYITHFRSGKKDIRAFFTDHQPDIVLYDIAIPYEKNWEFFQHVRAVSGLKPCQFVLTTTNKAVLEGLVGETGSLEIIGKPTDLDTLMNAVRSSFEQCRK
jgi:CheY-like chemotaxis protein